MYIPTFLSIAIARINKSIMSLEPSANMCSRKTCRDTADVYHASKSMETTLCANTALVFFLYKCLRN